MAKVIKHIDDFLDKLYVLGKSRPIFLLTLIFLLSFFSIFSNVYFDPNGAVTITNPLSLAQNLIHSNNFILFSAINQIPHYTSYPLGYPTLIAFTSYITSTSILWASKILSCFSIISIMLIFYKIYKKDSWIFALVLLTADLQMIYSFSWTENVFLTFLIAFIAFLGRYLDNIGNNFLNLICIGVSILGCFLIRYVGLFTSIVVFITIIWIWINTKKFDYKLSFITFIVNILCLGYLLLCYLHSGKVAKLSLHNGEFKQPVQSVQVLVEKLLEALLKSFTIPLVDKFSWLSIVAMFFTLQIFIFVYLAKTTNINSTKKYHTKNIKSVWSVALLGAFIYLFVLLIIRFNIALDNFSYRYLAPFTFLVFLSGLDYLRSHNRVYFKVSAKFLLIMGALSLLINSPLKHWHNRYIENPRKKTYSENMNDFVDKYDFIADTPTKIAFGNLALNYRKLNVSTPSPLTISESRQKARHMDSFLKKLKQFEGEAYVEIKTVPKLDGPYHYHPSVRDFMEAHSEKSFVKIK